VIRDLIMAAGHADSRSIQGLLVGSDTVSGDLLGSSVAVASADGNTVAVASITSVASGTRYGAVYIFTRTGSVWAQQAKLSAGDQVSGDRFGYSVALSSDGSTCVVGKTLIATGTGAVYVFTRSGTTWTQQAKLTASDAHTSDQFGYSVDLSGDGNTCAIGSYNAVISGNNHAGAAYIFTRSGTTWTQQAKLTASDSAASDYFGTSIRLNSTDGNTCAVGSPGHTNSNGTSAGSVYIFTRSGTTWTQQVILQSPLAYAVNSFGNKVELSASGNDLAVSSITSSTGHQGYGAVDIFTRSGTTWSHQQELDAPVYIAGSPSGFGNDIALSNDGNELLVGEPTRRNMALPNSGGVVLYTRTGTTWALDAVITAFDVASSNQLGYSVAISGDAKSFVAGAPYKASGCAYAFTR